MCGLGEKDVHRTKENFQFASGELGLVIIDSDNLGALNLHDTNSFAKALELLIGDADYSLSPSASSGITVNSIVGPIKGMHAFVFIHDASQIPETLEILHKRSVLMGYGYPLVTKAGVILIRSLVDTAMKTPNQPCFEGGAILAEGLTQDRKISYRQHCDEPRYLNVVPLSLEEDAEFEIKTKELTDSVAEAAAAIRASWLEEHGKKLAAKGFEPGTIKNILDAALSVERPILSSDFEIYTDNYGIKTVRELLADPEVYHEATCGDPLDPDDGVGKAKIYTLNKDGRPAIHSFAHGGATYILEEDLFTDLTKENCADTSISPITSEPKCILDLLTSYSATGDSEQMKSQMLEDKFVLLGLAIAGQWTTLYASPNTGKTLITIAELRKQIECGSVSGADVFYVNADDSYNAAVIKIEIAEQFGMHMLIPNHRNFKAKNMLPLIRGLIEQKKARNKIIVLDTLKKFTDLMDKKSASEFGNIAREFIAAGGTLICLAHTNKHKDADGKGIYAGTSDIVDDSDCVYIIDKIGVDDLTGKHVVEFTNIKARGDVHTTASFEYTRDAGQTYQQLLGSVVRMDSQAVEVVKKKTAIEKQLELDEELIDAIRDCINAGPLPKNEMISKINKDSGFTHKQIRQVLRRYTGYSYADGARWAEAKGDKNKSIFTLLHPPSPFS
jgi:archaellum biogenesis ATPase FlaH